MNILVKLWPLWTITPSVLSLLRCQESDTSFQLLSGYVYTNTDDIIKTMVSKIIKTKFNYPCIKIANSLYR